VTWAFFYLVVFLAGFFLALVGGLVRRILHPAELCDHVVVPSHEHWASLRTPRADFIVSLLTGFGLSALLLHGLTTLDPKHEMLISLAAGIVLAIAIRSWLCRSVEPADPGSCVGGKAVVVRRIPAEGFGQVEVEVCGCAVKLAARSASGRPIEEGGTVRVLDRNESVLVVTAEDAGGA
jgi:membrane protein implicated in regulation of membrane protease activity